jgi:hypothetical protein
MGAVNGRSILITDIGKSGLTGSSHEIKTAVEERQWAIGQYLKGISPESIYLSLGRSKAWLSRYDPDNPDYRVFR